MKKKGTTEIESDSSTDTKKGKKKQENNNISDKKIRDSINNGEIKDKESKKSTVDTKGENEKPKKSEPKEKKEERKRNFSEKLVRGKELFLGRTKKQNKKDKQSYIGKKYALLFFFFTVANLFLFLEMNLPKNNPFLKFLSIISIKNPYNYGLAITFTFLEFSLFFTNDRLLKWFFNEKMVLKQFGIFFGLLYINFGIVTFLRIRGSVFYSTVLFLAIFWMILQSFRIFFSSRSFGTRLEATWTERYSKFTSFLATIMPYLILFGLLIMTWALRYGIVVFTLDTLGSKEPALTMKIYGLEMNLVMPLIYIGLILIFIFILVNTYLTRRKGQTGRSGKYDNLTYAIICFFMYLFVVYNIFLFLFLSEDMTETISKVYGTTQNSQTMFIIEFAISTFFFLWIASDISSQFEGGFLFFSRDGFLLFIMTTIMAQTTSRLGNLEGYAADLSGWGNFLTLDYIILPILIIVLLGISLLYYYMNPNKTSMFLRINKEAVDKKDKKMDIMLKFLKREFIRRGESFEIDKPLMKQICAVSNLTPAVAWSLVKRMEEKYMDFELTEVKDKEGNVRKWVEFLSIVETYQADGYAQQRANAYMRDRFSQTIATDKRKSVKFYKGKKSSLSSTKQSDLFLSALSTSYSKKVKEEQKREKDKIEKKVTVEIDKKIDTDTEYLIMNMIRETYLSRIEQVTDYNDLKMKVSDVARRVQKATNVSPGRLYPFLEKIAYKNKIFNLIPTEDKEDEIIEYIPLYDLEMSNSLFRFRPEAEATIKTRAMVTNMFSKYIAYDRVKGGIRATIPLKYENKDKEFKRSYRSKFWAKALRTFNSDLKKRVEIYFNMPGQTIFAAHKKIAELINGKQEDFKTWKYIPRRFKKLPEYSFSPKTWKK